MPIVNTRRKALIESCIGLKANIKTTFLEDSRLLTYSILQSIHWSEEVGSTMQEAEVKVSQFKANPGKVSIRPYLKNKLKTKGIVQVVEHLPIKCETLSSIPST
jgi:hypothetical protein